MIMMGDVKFMGDKNYKGEFRNRQYFTDYHMCD